MQLFVCVLILIICCLFLGLWYGFQMIASFFLPPPFATILTVFIFYHLLVEMCRKFTFPGSMWLWKRNIENHYQRTMAVKIRKKILLLKTLVLYISEGNTMWKELIPQCERRDISKAISQVLNLYGKQVMHKTLNERQKVMMEQFNQIDRALNFTNLVGKTCGKGITFWEFLTDDKNQAEIMEPSEYNFKYLFYSRKIDLNFVFEDNTKSKYLLEQCKTLEIQLHNIVREISGFASIKRWLFETSFGTVDHVREELDRRYKCQPISIKVSGNNVIDCVLITGKTKDVIANSAPASKDLESIELNLIPQASKRTQASSIKNKGSGPTMILCCPNAGYYEYTCYESQWVDVYLNLGFNVFLWNYRGYGRSTGKPDPAALRSDGEAIVDYLREDMGIEIIGCHGESIGGIVATHIARWKDLDYLCADRTFASLFTVGRLSFGRGLCLLYRIITGWDDRLVLDFLESKCYKVITFDPKDEVIPFLCSLQHGITSRIIQTRLGFTAGEPVRPAEKGDYRIYSPFGWISRIKRLVYCVRSEMFVEKMDKKMKQDYGSLPKEQMKALYKALTRVYDLYETFGFLKNDTNIKKHRRMVSIGGLPKLTTPKKVASQAGDQMNASPMSMQAGNEENIAASVSVSDVSVMPTTRKECHEMKRVKSELTIANRLSNQSGVSLTPDITQNIDYAASLDKQQYDNLFDRDAQKDTELVIFLENVFSSMELFELGGVQVETIMALPEIQRFQAFKHFLDSLETWGSYLPLQQALKEDVTHLSYHQNKAIRKLRLLTKRLDHVTKLERTKDQGNTLASTPSLLKNLILEDVELITSLLPVIMKNTRIGDENDYRKHVNNSEGIELMPTNVKEELGQPLLEAQIDMEKRPRKDYSSTVGHLIPLCCGHNGNLRPLEIEIYEQYVKNAGLV